MGRRFASAHVGIVDDVVMHECGRLEHLDRACQVEHCTGLRTLFLLAVRFAGGQGGVTTA